MRNIYITKKSFLRGVLPPWCYEQLKISISCRFQVPCVVGFFYLHLMDCLHVLLSIRRLSLKFVPANNRQLSLPSSAWKSLEKIVVYKVTSGKEQNSCKPTGLWLDLSPSQYWTSSVIGGGPIMEDKDFFFAEKLKLNIKYEHNFFYWTQLGDYNGHVTNKITNCTIIGLSRTIILYPNKDIISFNFFFIKN